MALPIVPAITVFPFARVCLSRGVTAGDTKKQIVLDYDMIGSDTGETWRSTNGNAGNKRPVPPQKYVVFQGDLGQNVFY